ncbi:MAG TPA: immunoglobulin domain-containing protein [Verrucomicrobiae bacterium]|nr:immunoglobulin domain-containing protein [Verrucomicrobiae bacterium]
MKPAAFFRTLLAIALTEIFGHSAQAALLAYEPFTNSVGATIIGSGDGGGFNGVWQSNSSQGVATNTAYGLSYKDSAGHSLVTAGGAGFFQGLTTANNSMQPYRLFNFSRGTNGTDGVTTWISFLVARQGPTGTLSGNPYGRGANVDHDLNSGALQKLAIGNSSGVGSNTVALIPQGSAANCVGDPNSTFGERTNFIVVRVDHNPGGNDSAWLFVNPILGTEPSTNSAGAVSLGNFDFSFDRLRVFAGGQSSASQPYAEMVLDEYRLGETYADVTPIVSAAGATGFVITNIQLIGGNVVLRGTGGTNSGVFNLLGGADFSTAPTNWPVLATNNFDGNGNFSVTSSLPSGSQHFYLLKILDSSGAVAPTVEDGPMSLTVTQGQSATFDVTADGTAPLNYQWYFDTNKVLAGQTASTITLLNVQRTNAGTYFVHVSNTAGGIDSPSAVLTVFSPPEIASQPVNAATYIGGTAAFNVAAAGTAPLHYQWYFNTNTLLTAATNATLTINNAQTTNAGAYFVAISNNYGAVTSSVVSLTVNDSSLTNGAYFVSPAGNDSNPGTLASPFLTIGKGLTAIGSGGQLYLRGGVYPLSSKLGLSKTASPTNMLRIWEYPGETPVIDFTGDSSDGISISGSWYHLKGIISTHAGHNGINISGANNIIEMCTTCSNANTGTHITGSLNTSNNLVLNCDSYHNYDAPTHGQNADGFTAKWIFGPGNVFSGCRAWENADDGWDLWMGTNTVVITNCWSIRNGTNVFGDTAWQGNGNGFKLGGNYVATPHRLVRSMSVLNMVNGVDQNNNLAGQTLDNDTCWGNGGRNFSMAHGANTTPHIVRNNISFGAHSSDSFTSGTLSTNNSWQIISPTVNAGDFQSMDYSTLTGPRQADGSLPDLPFLHPVLGGRLVNQGVDTGDPYSGSAPDLGAFEVQ